MHYYSLFEIVAVVTKHVESVGHKAAKLHPRDPQPAMREICDLHSLPQFSPVKANDADFLEEVRIEELSKLSHTLYSFRS